jgi:RNA polymerase sigma factor (sigma-70 family)
VTSVALERPCTDGDDRAFEALYARYHRRIADYVLAVVKDRGRAEDVTQEVFVSALRRFRAGERPFAFGPWIHTVARHACIDELRRSRRSQEVSFDAIEPGLLAATAPSPEAAVLAKQQLDHLCGAFGGLTDTYHEVLVLRELEGLSCGAIGERLGMSRAAVESTLFRARRRLAEEYEELATGARCRRIQHTIALLPAVRFGRRETKQVSRHVAHCPPCRRQALAAGIDPSILTDVPLRRRAAGKVAALLPLPSVTWLDRARVRGDAAASTGAGLAAHAPQSSEALNAGWATAAAVVVALVAGVGATVSGTPLTHDRGDAPPPRTRPAQQPSPAAVAATAAGSARAGTAWGAKRPDSRAGSARTTGAVSDGPRRAELARGGERTDRDRSRTSTPSPGTPAPAGSPAAAAAPGGEAAGREDSPAQDVPSGGVGDGDGGSGGGASPAADPPGGGHPQPLKPVTDGARHTVTDTLAGVDQTVKGVTETLDGVNQTVGATAPGLGATAQGVQETVAGVAGGLGETLDGVGGLLRP